MLIPNLMNKKIVIVIGLIALLSLIAGVVLLVSGQGSAPEQQTRSQTELKKLTDDQTVSPVLSFDGRRVWYFTPQGRLFWVNADGSGLSEFAIPALENSLKTVLWPKTSGDFIAVTTQAAGEVKYYYDNNQKQYVELPANIQALDWMPDDRRIIYIWKSGDNIHQQLVIANPDASGFQVIKEVFWPDLKVKVSPDGTEALLVRGRIEGDANKIYRADLESGEFEIVIGEGKNLDVRWVSSDKFIFAQTASGLYPKLSLYNFGNHQQTDLNLATNLDKTALDTDKKFLYAAVPKKDNTGDELVKVDLTTFKQDVIYRPSEDIRAKDMLLFGNALYFVNSRDNKLYSLNLPL